MILIKKLYVLSSIENLTSVVVIIHIIYAFSEFVAFFSVTLIEQENLVNEL